MIESVVFVVAFVVVTIWSVFGRLWRPFKASERWKAEEDEEDAAG